MPSNGRIAPDVDSRCGHGPPRTPRPDGWRRPPDDDRPGPQPAHLREQASPVFEYCAMPIMVRLLDKVGRGSDTVKTAATVESCQATSSVPPLSADRHRIPAACREA